MKTNKCARGSLSRGVSASSKRSGARLLVVMAMIFAAMSVSAEIRRNPNGVNVNSQGPTSVFVTFGGLDDQVPVEATWCGELISAAPDIGQRCDPSTIFGRLPVRFDQSKLSSNSAVFTDIMSIPPSVARRAYQAAASGETSSFFYVRRFVSTTGGPDEFVFVTCRLAGGGARVPLALLDVQVRFAGEETVEAVDRGGLLPDSVAEIAYNGTGRLRGRWEVVLPGEEPPSSRDLLTAASLAPEERALQRRFNVINRFDVFLPPTGRTVLPGPDPKRLPTQLDGLYQVLLRVEASDDKEGDSSLAAAGAGNGVIHSGAVAGFPMPVLRYAVGSAGGLTAVRSGLELLLPEPGYTLSSAALDFEWSQSNDAALYRLEIRDPRGALLHQAVLQQGIGKYRAPDWIAVRGSGGTATWRVVVVSSDGRDAAAAPWREIVFP